MVSVLGLVIWTVDSGIFSDDPLMRYGFGTQTVGMALEGGAVGSDSGKLVG
jgi:hypothetical protein